jgi:hypothetical protein
VLPHGVDGDGEGEHQARCAQHVDPHQVGGIKDEVEQGDEVVAERNGDGGEGDQAAAHRGDEEEECDDLPDGEGGGGPEVHAVGHPLGKVTGQVVLGWGIQGGVDRLVGRRIGVAVRAGGRALAAAVAVECVL